MVTKFSVPFYFSAKKSIFKQLSLVRRTKPLTTKIKIRPERLKFHTFSSFRYRISNSILYHIFKLFLSFSNTKLRKNATTIHGELQASSKGAYFTHTELGLELFPKHVVGQTQVLGSTCELVVLIVSRLTSQKNLSSTSVTIEINNTVLGPLSLLSLDSVVG